VRFEVLRRVAERYVCGELALQSEVERTWNPVTATLSVTLVLLLLLVLADSSLERVEVELRRKVLGKGTCRTNAHVVAF